MKNAASLLIFLGATAAIVLAGDVQTRVVTNTTSLLVDVPDHFHLRIFNFTQERGSTRGVVIAAAAAVVALVIVVLVGVLARTPLARVPENTLKFAVGSLLTTFGIFWGAEGAGASWPGSDAALPLILPGFALASFVLVQMLRRERQLRPIGAGS